MYVNVQYMDAMGIYYVNFGAAHNMCWGLNSHQFHIVGDGHQPNSKGLCLYTHYKDSFFQGGMSLSPI